MAIENLFILFSLSLSLLAHAHNNPCPNSYCDKNPQSVQFPFWIQGQQPDNCGLPGFNLTCNAQKRSPVLKITNSGQFYVKSIYYSIRRVTLIDPDNCLPARLLNLNLSNTPFIAASYENYTFFSCPKGQFYSDSVISCLSNATKDVMAVSYNDDYVGLVPMCKRIAVLQVPTSSFFRVGFPIELELTWDVSTCKRCGPEKGAGSANGRPVLHVALTLVMLSVVIPVLIIGISCCVCITRRQNPHDQTDEPGRAFARSTSSDTVTAARLDTTTIETYRMTTNCQNEGRLKDLACSICLTDYILTDAIMIMHECQHCFHADCITKWLNVSSKCPNCRTLQTA
ncbi:hypothetical protein CASFOL_005987 [Castilleja foliolosa]|uniref:RING-type E3 ubiquitin transferase n=1 Tax=Castilleja foliolosa TaxID=1961234 RepID=A0ABD3E901_9LAMI